MCVGAAISPLGFGLSQSKTGQKILNNTPLGLGYKGISGSKLSDSVQDGSIVTGLATSMALKKSSNQFSMA